MPRTPWTLPAAAAVQDAALAAAPAPPGLGFERKAALFGLALAAAALAGGAGLIVWRLRRRPAGPG